MISIFFYFFNSKNNLLVNSWLNIYEKWGFEILFIVLNVKYYRFEQRNLPI